jgi:hypothetical protein
LNAHLSTKEKTNSPVEPRQQFPSHADQYKMLRDEIMHYMSEIYKTQAWGATATVAIYAWLFTHTTAIMWPYCWYLAPCVILVSLLRCIDHNYRIHDIAKYLAQIEGAAFGKSRELPGWENYKCRTSRKDQLTQITIASIWAVALAGSVTVSWKLSHADFSKRNQEPNTLLIRTNVTPGSLTKP